MKILTNIQNGHLAGITQTMLSFLNYLEKSNEKKVEVCGLNIVSSRNKEKSIFENKFGKGFKTISVECAFGSVKEVINSSRNLKDVKNCYKNLIGVCRDVIARENPDLVLVNGTYFFPWCLYEASKDFNIPVLLHYHGILTKETESWKKEEERRLFYLMEKCFDNKDLFYIFPSNLAKETVEKEVFKHKIKNCSVLPNPVPAHFFNNFKRRNTKNVGFVTRWSKIKNPDFIAKFAAYNQKNGSNFKVNVITELRNEASRQKLEEIIKFRKAVRNEEIGKFYSNMNVVLSPSHFETYGNVAQEAIASGTPALVSKKMGVAETFKKLGLDDWVVDFSSVENVYKKAVEISGQMVRPEVVETLKNDFSSNSIYKSFLKIIKTANSQ